MVTKIASDEFYPISKKVDGGPCTLFKGIDRELQHVYTNKSIKPFFERLELYRYFLDPSSFHNLLQELQRYIRDDSYKKLFTKNQTRRDVLWQKLDNTLTDKLRIADDMQKNDQQNSNLQTTSAPKTHSSFKISKLLGFMALIPSPTTATTLNASPQDVCYANATQLMLPPAPYPAYKPITPVPVQDQPLVFNSKSFQINEDAKILEQQMISDALYELAVFGNTDDLARKFKLIKEKFHNSPLLQNSINVLLSDGDKALSSGNYNMAKNIFESVVKVDPGLQFAQKGLQAAKYFLDNKNKLVNIEKRAIEFNVNNKIIEDDIPHRYFASFDYKLYKEKGIVKLNHHSNKTNSIRKIEELYKQTKIHMDKKDNLKAVNQLKQLIGELKKLEDPHFNGVAAVANDILASLYLLLGNQSLKESNEKLAIIYYLAAIDCRDIFKQIFTRFDLDIYIDLLENYLGLTRKATDIDSNYELKLFDATRMACQSNLSDIKSLKRYHALITRANSDENWRNVLKKRYFKQSIHKKSAFIDANINRWNSLIQQGNYSHINLYKDIVLSELRWFGNNISEYKDIASVMEQAESISIYEDTKTILIYSMIFSISFFVFKSLGRFLIDQWQLRKQQPIPPTYKTHKKIVSEKTKMPLKMLRALAAEEAKKLAEEEENKSATVMQQEQSKTETKNTRSIEENKQNMLPMIEENVIKPQKRKKQKLKKLPTESTVESVVEPESTLEPQFEDEEVFPVISINEKPKKPKKQKLKKSSMQKQDKEYPLSSLSKEISTQANLDSQSNPEVAATDTPDLVVEPFSNYPICNTHFSPALNKVIGILAKYNCHYGFVGSFAQFLLLDKPHSDYESIDIDMVVFNFSLYQLQNAFDNCEVFEGGSIRLNFNNCTIDITNIDYKIEGNPNKALEKAIVENAKGRDLTINTIVVMWSNQSVYFPFGSDLDWQNKILKSLGKPQENLKDPRRRLRCILKKNKLGFTIDNDTKIALTYNYVESDNLNIPLAISFFNTLKKFFAELGTEKALTYFHKYNWFENFKLSQDQRLAIYKKLNPTFKIEGFLLHNDDRGKFMPLAVHKAIIAVATKKKEAIHDVIFLIENEAKLNQIDTYGNLPLDLLIKWNITNEKKENYVQAKAIKFQECMIYLIIAGAPSNRSGLEIFLQPGRSIWNAAPPPVICPPTSLPARTMSNRL